MAYNVSSAERVLKDRNHESFAAKERQGVLRSIIDFFWNDGGDSSNDHVWPVSLSNTFSHESIFGPWLCMFVATYLFHGIGILV